MDYQEFLSTKTISIKDSNYSGDVWTPFSMFDFQVDCVKWALTRGRAALFLDTGLGKSITQLCWAWNVANFTGKPVLIVAPLAVAQQTVREGEKFEIYSEYIRKAPYQYEHSVYITNYEMLKHFNPDSFGGIVLDESSILKGMNGKVRKQITEFAKGIIFRLSCTATPSPNDFMELGTQSEFLGIMSQVEMLATYFIHDGSDTSKWRLKGHGKFKFWEWLATWSIVLKHPSDLGYEAVGYDLPPVKYHSHVIETEATDGLFTTVAMGLNERNKARRDSVNDRCAMASEIANGLVGPVLIWCNLNDESAILEKDIPESKQVTGSMKPEDKERALIEFSDGDLRILISKPKIAGFGMNWQHCHNIIFVGLSDSWESYYQAIRRCWRFGQKHIVSVHIVSADTEGAVVENIRRKEIQNKEMGDRMSALMKEFTLDQIKGCGVEKSEYNAEVKFIKPNF